MWEKAEALKLRNGDRRKLQRLVRGRNTAQKVVLRAQIVLGASEGRSNNELAQGLGTSRPTVILWRNRYEEEGVQGLVKDASRPGRKPRLSAKKVEAVVNATLHTKPRTATHWSVRSMAKTQRLSHARFCPPDSRLRSHVRWGVLPYYTCNKCPGADATGDTSI